MTPMFRIVVGAVSAVAVLALASCLLQGAQDEPVASAPAPHAHTAARRQ